MGFLLPRLSTPQKITDKTKSRNDSLNSKEIQMNLTSHYAASNIFYTVPTSSQLIKFKILGNHFKYWKGPSNSDNSNLQYIFSTIPLVNWDEVIALNKIFGPDFHYRSGYIPAIVQNYLEYKMGRDAYLSVVSISRPGIIKVGDFVGENENSRVKINVDDLE
jgi:hypothetical protein